ncbi:MAG: GNAT family N-acetyltransferase [Acidobacteria bacterium]|nr:GNAT family N-acetyltransferase [Acidobacteriota bacterium]
MTQAERIQSYLREIARSQYRVEHVPPFTAFLHPTDALVHFNYAIPDAGPLAGDLQTPLRELSAVFAARGRTPRFEFVEACAPGLAEALAANGFTEELRALLMTATADTARPLTVPGLAIEVLDRAADPDQVRPLLDLQREVFGAGGEPASRADARRALDVLGDGAILAGRLHGALVSVAFLQPSRDGLAEVAGVATLETFRRRGIAGALTSAALSRAFERGVTLALLSAASEAAGRVYAGAGFESAGYVLMWAQVEPG